MSQKRIVYCFIKFYIQTFLWNVIKEKYLLYTVSVLRSSNYYVSILPGWTMKGHKLITVKMINDGKVNHRRPESIPTPKIVTLLWIISPDLSPSFDFSYRCVKFYGRAVLCQIEQTRHVNWHTTTNWVSSGSRRGRGDSSSVVHVSSSRKGLHLCAVSRLIRPRV